MQNYVFFHTRPTTTWPFPIWNALNATTSKTLREAWSRPDSRTLGDFAIALATKLAILGTVVRRFNLDYTRLLKLADEDAERIKVNRETGTVWSLSADRLTYELLAGIDAFIFEARSTYEILGKFLITFYRIIFAQALTEEHLKGILREDGLDVAWATLLHDERILFFHQTAPWLALMFDDAKSAPPELVIVRGNVKTLDDPNRFLLVAAMLVHLTMLRARFDADANEVARIAASAGRMIGASEESRRASSSLRRCRDRSLDRWNQSFMRLSDYNRIYTGLESALGKLQQYLVERIREFEKGDAPN